MTYSYISKEQITDNLNDKVKQLDRNQNTSKRILIQYLEY